MKITKLYAENNKVGPINMTLSENPLGCSPLVLKAIKSLKINDISRYPLLDELKVEISKQFDIPFSSIVLGCGSEQLIKLIAQTLLSNSSLVLIQSGSFPLFLKESLLAKARVMFFDPKTKSKSLKPSVVFLANPNNTNGEITPSKKILEIVNRFPNSIIVIDEANGEFLENSFIEKVEKSKKCIVLRSLSKLSGLAGLRVGFAVGPAKLIKRLNEGQQPFPISSISSKLAIESFRSRKFIQKSINFFDIERKFLIKELKQRGFDVSKSVTNNIFVGTENALALQEELSKRGVSVIDSSFFPGINKPGFRISIKGQKTNREFIKVLDSIAFNRK